MIELRRAEKGLMDLAIELHWLAGRSDNLAVAERLRAIADTLNDEAMELRELWVSGFWELE